MMRRFNVVASTAAVVFFALAPRPIAVQGDLPPGRHWVGTWATPPVVQPQDANSVGFNNQTLRQIVRVSIGGSELRVRLSNLFGGSDIRAASVHVALREKGAAIKAGSDRTLTFGGTTSATLWAGTTLISDPVRLDVPALADLAISIYLPGDIPASLPITYHRVAAQTNYISPPGDHAADRDIAGATTTRSWYFVTGVDVAAPRGVGGIVTLGDSLTDANVSTPDTNSRWPDALAGKLHAARISMGIMNAGTSGGRVLHDDVGESGLRRFDRDVLSQPGVTHVVVLLGINDLRFAALRGGASEVTADDVIAGYRQMILRAHAKGIKIIGGTLLPWEDETFAQGAYTPEGGAKHKTINDWIRNSKAFDAVVDFNKVLADPAHPTRMLEKWDCGDRLHPNDAGYRHMGESIDLALFQ